MANIPQIPIPFKNPKWTQFLYLSHASVDPNPTLSPTTPTPPLVVHFSSWQFCLQRHPKDSSGCICTKARRNPKPWNLESRIWGSFLLFPTCSQYVPNMFPVGSHQVPNMLPRFPICSPRVFPIAPRFNPICFAQSPPHILFHIN